MNIRFLVSPLFRTLALSISLTAASSVGATQLFLGAPVAVGNGTARLLVVATDAGVPSSVSIVLQRAALDGLPEATANQHEWEYHLPMPAEAPPTGYTHAALNWNPAGHIPEGVYSVPHFDFHFYLIDDAARNAITYRDGTAPRPPRPELIPAGYVVPPDTAVERMGEHGVNPQGEEFLGRPFRHTFIYGYHGGELIFVEPMITRDFLLSAPDVTLPVTRPLAYSVDGHYPGRYRIGYDPASAEFRIALMDLRPFAGTGTRPLAGR